MTKLLNAVLACKATFVPVGVCTATKRKDVEFKTLHAECLSPISTNKECPTCQRSNLLAEETVKGFEFAKKQYIAIDADELKEQSSGSSSVIEINKFVRWDSIDELQVEKSYYLEPASVLVRPYALLSNAMSGKEVVGLGVTSLWGKEYPSMVWTRESGVIVLSMLYCHDEVIDDRSISEMAEVPVVAEEQELTNQLVAFLIRDLNPQEDLVSHSRNRIADYLKAKVTGVDFDFVEPAPLPDASTDITESLRKSIAMAREA